MQPIRSLWLASFLSVTVVGVNAQTVFKCKNDQGQMVYSDAPCSYRADSIKIQQNPRIPMPSVFGKAKDVSEGDALRRVYVKHELKP